MELDEQVVPSGTCPVTERVVPLSRVKSKNADIGVPTKSGLRRVASVRGGLTGYGVVVGSGGGVGAIGGVIPAPGMVSGVVPGTFGVVGVPYGYAAAPGVPGYGGGYRYGCVGVPGQGIVVPPGKKVDVVAKLPEVTSGSKGKPRWSTPRRRGNWKEKWGCAKDWGAKSTVGREDVREMCEVVRCVVSEEISRRCKALGVGRPTVEKWMCLLAEYLELNGDEHVLLAVLISRYGKGKRGWTGENDWCRPQRWECVVALAAYMAVLLSEEFPGKVAQDLQELLGRNFRFGREQIAFLLAIEWRVNVGQEEFEHVQRLIEGAAKEIKGKMGPERMTGPHFKKFVEWFSGQRKESVVKKAPVAKATTNVQIAPKFVAMSPITPEMNNNDGFVGKKRPRDLMTLSDDDELSVPGAKKRASVRRTQSMTEYQQVHIVPSMQDLAY